MWKSFSLKSNIPSLSFHLDSRPKLNQNASIVVTKIPLIKKEWCKIHVHYTTIERIPFCVCVTQYLRWGGYTNIKIKNSEGGRVIQI